MALNVSFQEVLDAEMNKIRENKVERTGRLKSIMDVLDNNILVKGFTKELQNMCEGCGDLTATTMDMDGCPLEDCFPYKNSKRINLNGNNYFVDMNIIVRKVD